MADADGGFGCLDQFPRKALEHVPAPPLRGSVVPQSHLMWHRIAPALADEFTVVCADLRGYGDSSKPPSTPDHEPYSKRAMRAIKWPSCRRSGSRNSWQSVMIQPV